MSSARRRQVITVYDLVLKPVLTDVLSTKTPSHPCDLILKLDLANVYSTKTCRQRVTILVQQLYSQTSGVLGVVGQTALAQSPSPGVVVGGQFVVTVI